MWRTVTATHLLLTPRRKAALDRRCETHLHSQLEFYQIQIRSNDLPTTRRTSRRKDF
jgi:hypothetical protein